MKTASADAFEIRGNYSAKYLESKSRFVAKVLEFVDAATIGPIKVLVNCGNGAAGPVMNEISQALGIVKSGLEIVPLHPEPDASFPNGIPNPILRQNHAATGDGGGGSRLWGCL